MTALQQACSNCPVRNGGKAERHQGKHFPIALHQLGEKPGTESCEYLVQHIQRSGEVGIAENIQQKQTKWNVITMPKKRRMP